MFVFFFNDTATTEIYTLSLHDALPISCAVCQVRSTTSPTRPMACASEPIIEMAPRSCSRSSAAIVVGRIRLSAKARSSRSEEHTSELQSRQYLVCRLLLEKKKYYINSF